MWSGKVDAYTGKHYQLAETLCVPLPLSKPHPPILIGGLGEQKTLRMVAQYADACNLFDRIGWDNLQHKLDVLKGHCDTLKRDYATIEKTSLSTVQLAPGQMNASEVIAHCRKLADLGIQHAIFNMPDVETITPLETFAKEIIPAVSGF